MAGKLSGLLFLLVAASSRQIKPTSIVILMEGDLLTPETCEEVKKVSLFPSSVEFLGYWFCVGSILGRFVDYNTLKYTGVARLVHYRLRDRETCLSDRFTRVKDVFIYAGQPKDGETAIFQQTDDVAYESEFVQKAITAVEKLTETMCE